MASGGPRFIDVYSRCATKNLGPRARREQLRAGVIWLGVALFTGFALVELGAVAAYGWLLLLPLALGSYAMLAGLFGVCVFAGARGGRRADYGYELVADCTLRRTLRNRSAGVLLVSLGFAAVSTFVFIASA
jgi:hypothetical protein